MILLADYNNSKIYHLLHFWFLFRENNRYTFFLKKRNLLSMQALLIIHITTFFFCESANYEKRHLNCKPCIWLQLILIYGITQSIMIPQKKIGVKIIASLITKS